jgi:hypothetical protein
MRHLLNCSKGALEVEVGGVKHLQAQAMTWLQQLIEIKRQQLRQKALMLETRVFFGVAKAQRTMQ